MDQYKDSENKTNKQKYIYIYRSIVIKNRDEIIFIKDLYQEVISKKITKIIRFYKYIKKHYLKTTN